MNKTSPMMLAMVFLATGCMGQQKELAVDNLYDVEVQTIAFIAGEGNLPSVSRPGAEMVYGVHIAGNARYFLAVTVEQEHLVSFVPANIAGADQA